MSALIAGGVTAALVLFGVPVAYAGTSERAQRRPQTATATPSLRWQLCPEDTDAWPDERCATVSVPQD